MGKIRFCWKDSGFVGRHQVSPVLMSIWHDDGMIRNKGRVLRIMLGKFWMYYGTSEIRLQQLKMLYLYSRLSGG
jgi:hypothetical protein